MGVIETFYIKRNDLQPYYQAVVNDADGDPVGISGATIYATMQKAEDGSIVTSRQTTGCNITSADGGLFEYQWQASDTVEAGRFFIEFEITPASGGKFTIPNREDEKAEIIILEDLDAT
jgi:hypothetical protein